MRLVTEAPPTLYALTRPAKSGSWERGARDEKTWVPG